MKFLKKLFLLMLGSSILLLLFLFIIGIVTSFLIENKKPSFTANSVLEIKLDQRIKDYVPRNFEQFDDLFDAENQDLGLNRLLDAIKQASRDPKIIGISLQTNVLNSGLAQIKAIRDELKSFKNSGKFLYAYADVYSQKSYYLNSVADSIFVNPMGKVDVKGLSAEILYFKDIQEKSGIKVEVVKHGAYKSAAEPFLERKMSDKNRLQFTSFFDSIWSEIVKEISESRSISVEKLNEIANNLWGRDAILAKKHKLIDNTIYFDTYQEKLAMAMGIDSVDDYQKIELKNYLKTANFSKHANTASKDKIAVIYAQGDIIYGKGNENNIGPALIIGALKSARENPQTKAIVLRINSPGGSAFASELILRELKITSSKLPLVVSMGDYAASGGYYIACASDAIFAQPTTTTGSIGVFGLLLNLNEIFERIGVNSDRVSTHNGASYSAFKPMSNAYRSVLKEDIEKVYRTFIENVATNRAMTLKDVDEISSGKIWSGVQAKKIGLVDELGSLEDAIKHAAMLASIDDYTVWNLPNYKFTLKDKIATSLFSEVNSSIKLPFIGYDLQSILEKITLMTEQNQIQARLPFLFEIQ
jgi:protease-4